MKASLLALLLAVPAAAHPPSFLRFDPALDMPDFGFLGRAANAYYMILGDGWIKFAYLEDGVAREPLALKPPEIMLLRDRVIVRWPMRMLRGHRSGLETLRIERASGKAGVTRQLYDSEAFVAGWGSMDAPPLKRPVHREARLIREEDPAALDALRRLTPPPSPVIN